MQTSQTGSFVGPPLPGLLSTTRDGSDDDAGGREQKFDDITRTHRETLFSYALRLTRQDTALAEDIVQETLLRAWRQIDQLSPQQGKIIGWLLRVAQNVAIDLHRARSARPREVKVPEGDWHLGPVAPDLDDQVLAAMVVDKMMADIWPEHRAVIEILYFRDRSQTEAAVILGIPEGTVKSRHYYALRALRASARRIGLRAS